MYRYHCVLLRGLHILKYYHEHLVVKIYESFMFNKYYIYNVAGILKHPLDLPTSVSVLLFSLPASFYSLRGIYPSDQGLG